MINMRTILFVVGLVLCAVAAAMVPPALFDVMADDGEWVAFLASALTTAFFGISLCLAMRSRVVFSLSIRDAFVLTSLSWVATVVFAALPFMLSPATRLPPVDALFESVSGVTTTGATVIVGLDNLPRGILFWRSFLQWLGGVGIIIMAIVVLPFIRVGGMQLFRTESSDRSDKIVPSSFQLVRYIVSIYLVLTIACMFAYHAGGMDWFDAVNHGMTSVATGGFSTHDASLGRYANPAIHWTGIFFMIAGSVPFVAYVRTLRGEHWALFRDSQVQVLIAVLVVMSLLLGWWLADARGLPAWEALTHSTFNVVSIVTTTGYASSDYMSWGPAPVAAFLVLILIGGCTGSTSGGIKIYRHQIMFLMIRTHLTGLIRPRRVYAPTYAGRPVDGAIIISVLAFVSVFVLSLFVLTLGLAATGLDLVSSFSGAASALANVGPGLGPIIGPAGTFAPLNETAKAMLIVGMLLGRLEFFTLLVLLSPDFWR